jgi:hypothetical protein
LAELYGMVKLLIKVYKKRVVKITDWLTEFSKALQFSVKDIALRSRKVG